MTILIKNANIFLLVIFFHICAGICQITAEPACDGDDTSAMVQWYTQMYHFAQTNQNVTRHIVELQAKLHQMERHMEENRKTLEETHNKLDRCLNDQSQKTNGGDIVIQRRQDGSVDFYRNWAEYKKGFGNSSGEFFIGLDKLHQLTNSRPYELLIVLEDFEQERRYAKYDQFIVGSEAEKYALKQLGRYSGSAEDALSHHVGEKFTTKDQDNDNDARNCAVEYTGAWWYKHCHTSNLNGRYLRGEHPEYAQGVNWKPFKGYYYSLKFVEMIIRPC